ncbi:protein kinase domain-containing protein [Methanoregula sp. UBA64]|jgi:eukaryotic-like serine/threonine-protein kinase|uniref:protein kinase domain-containing protein n=1 Tax=Methanoregula sp. UBA64 TaxID=1915554 RepID=UPI0025E27A69|nr:protein kinase [Methanoregula sp. UBA64]
MTLAIGTRLHAELAGTTVTVVKKIGEGTQGEVYLVDGPQGQQALKWYKPEQATSGQRTAISYLVRTGPPYGAAGKRFIWPLDLVTADNTKQFGYLMARIDTQKYAELGEVWAHLKPVPSLSALCEISYELANSYRALHLSGHCYRDISAGNLMFDPITGDVLICDNDNVGVNHESRCQVWGTMEYMAPELIRGECDPSTETDLHALAVLLFYVWVWHHPFHGEMEYRYHCWDIPAKKQVYGITPVFIFDPDNPTNRLPGDPDYALAGRRWDLCPPALRAMFIRAFTEGLTQPARRVTEGEWQNLFLSLKDRLVSCPHCRAENFSSVDDLPMTCWHCRREIPPAPSLRIQRPWGTISVTLSLGTTLLSRHILHPNGSDDGSRAIGKVVPHPAIPGAAGIRNLSKTSWQVIFPDGITSDVPPGRAVPLNPKTTITMEGTSCTIQSAGCGDEP